MQIDLKKLPQTIDVAAISANTTISDVDFAVDLALAYGCASTCVNACYFDRSRQKKRGRTDVLNGVTAGFPFGGELTSVKLYACQQSLLMGAQEIDMVMNVGAFLSGDLQLVERELKLICDTIDVPVKVIIETALLEDAQIAEAARLAADCGAAYVKSGTGIYGKKITPQTVTMMKDAVGEKAEIKASGGIRSLDEAVALLEAGASRLGMSPGPAKEILQQLDQKLGRSTPDIQG